MTGQDQSIKQDQPQVDAVDAEDIEEEEEQFTPYNTEKISIDTKAMLLEACLRRLEQKTIILAPDFQRNEVWTTDKKSRLIESILLKIPIPMFYVSSDEKGIFSVVDGLQRLSTIRDFVLGKKYMETKNTAFKGDGFKLDHLEFWGNKYNDCTFKMLPLEMQNRILETEFTFTIINPGTPEEVKRNIFKRINTGGEPLTPQEIRNALYTGKATDLLKKLAQKKEFCDATSNSVKVNRMLDKELVLRSLAFMIRNYTQYPKNNDMDRFLSDTMRIINLMPDLESREAVKFFKEEREKKEGVLKKDILISDSKVLEQKFISGMVRAKEILGRHAFRRSYGGKKRAPINKSLFELLSVSLAKQSPDGYDALLAKEKKEKFLSRYSQLLDEFNFRNAISKDSLKYNSIQERHKQFAALLEEFTK
jgi:hypothetical protein